MLNFEFLLFRYQIEDSKKKGGLLTNIGMESLTPSQQQTVTVGSQVNSVPDPKTVKSVKNIPNKTVKSWEVLLSESSGSENESEMPRKPQIIEKFVCDKKVALREHDYCFAIYKMLKEEDKKPEQDLSEMDKILSNVALGKETSFVYIIRKPF